MFRDDLSVKVKSTLPEDQFHDAIVEAMEPLGIVDFTDGGKFTIDLAPKFRGAFTTTEIDGKVSAGKKPGEYVVKMYWDCSPTALTWIGVFCMIGLWLLALPWLMSGKIGKTAERALRDMD